MQNYCNKVFLRNSVIISYVYKLLMQEKMDDVKIEAIKQNKNRRIEPDKIYIEEIAFEDTYAK